MNWSVKIMKEEKWVSGIIFEKDGYEIDILHKDPITEEINTVGTIDLKSKDYNKIHAKTNSIGRYLHKHGLEAEHTVQGLKNKLSEIKKKEDKKKETIDNIKKIPILGDLNIRTWEQMSKIVEDNLYQRKDEFLMVLSNIVSLWFAKKDFFWLLIIGVRGCGKSELLRCFDNSEFTYTTDVFSLNALAPGWAKNDDGSNVYSLLDEMKDRTFINPDLTAALGQRKDVKIKGFKELSNAYDPRGLIKFSPGAGNRRYGGNFNFIGAITKKVYYINVELLEDMGRFLKLELKKIPFRLKIQHEPNTDVINHTVIGFLRNLKKKFDREKPVITIGKETDNYLMDIMDVYEEYIRVFPKKNQYGHFTGDYEYMDQYDIEEPSRRYKQIKMACEAKVFIENRKEITREDIDFFKPLLWGLDNQSVRLAKMTLFPKAKLEILHTEYF